MKKVLFLIFTVFFIFCSCLIAEDLFEGDFNVPYLDFGLGGNLGTGLSKQYGSGGTISERDFNGGTFMAFMNGHFPVSRNIAMLVNLFFQNNGTEYPENIYYYKNQYDSMAFGGTLGIRIYLK